MTTNNFISNNSNQHFSIKFEFVPTLSDKHSIDIEIYKTSLKGIETVLRRANQLTNGKQDNLKIEILANDEGSFIVVFILFYLNCCITEPINILNLLGFSGNLIEDPGDLYGLMGFTLSLLSFLKAIREKRIEKEVFVDPNTVLIITEDGKTIRGNKEVVKYYKDPELREGLDNATKCLENPEISNMQFSDGSEHYEPIIINKYERDYFVSLESDKILCETESFTHLKLEVILADFEKSSDKWRFRDVITKVAFEATLTDQKYVQTVSGGRTSFTAGTILDVDMDVSTYEYLPTHSIRYKRVITKVHNMSPEEKHILSKPDKKILTLDQFF